MTRCRVLTNRLVAIDDDGRALFLGDRDGEDFVLEPAFARCRGCPPVALGGVAILLGASDGYFSATTSPDIPMWHSSKEHHSPSLITDPRAFRCPSADLRGPAATVRGIAHRLHAAGDGDLDVTGGDALRREHHGLESRAADLVDCHGGHPIVQAAVEGRLPGGILTVAGLEHVAHDALVDEGRIDAGTGDRLTNDQGAELRSGEVLEHTEELAGRRANG